MVDGEFVMENPCRDCNHRDAGCHGNCEAYLEWRKQYDKMCHNMRHNRRQRTIGYLGEHYRRNCK